MKKIAILLFILTLKGFSQRNYFEFSLGHVNDKNFNENVPSLGLLLPAPIIDNPLSILMSIGYERNFHPNFSVIVNARSVSRKINYYYLNTNIGGFFYNVIEVPVGLRLRKELNSQYKLFFDLAPGINFVLTNDNVTEKSITTDISSTADKSNKFQFVSSDKICYFTQAKINLLSKIGENNSFLFFLSYQYQFTELFRYRAYNNLFDLYGDPIKTHYFSLGLSYQFSFKSKN